MKMNFINVLMLKRGKEKKDKIMSKFEIHMLHSLMFKISTFIEIRHFPQRLFLFLEQSFGSMHRLTVKGRMYTH